MSQNETGRPSQRPAVSTITCLHDNDDGGRLVLIGFAIAGELLRIAEAPGLEPALRRCVYERVAHCLREAAA